MQVEQNDKTQQILSNFPSSLEEPSEDEKAPIDQA